MGHSSATRDGAPKMDRLKERAPNVRASGVKASERFVGKDAWWHVTCTREWLSVVRQHAGVDELMSSAPGGGRLPCGVLAPHVDRSAHGSSAPLELSMAYPSEDATGNDLVGGFSSASPEVVLCGKRDECYQQGLHGKDKKLLPIRADQLSAEKYWTESGEWTLPEKVVELGLAHIFVPEEREYSPLSAMLPDSYLHQLNPGKALQKMANMLYRDHNPDKKLSASSVLAGTEMISYLGMLMSQGRTSSVDQAPLQERVVGTLPTEAAEASGNSLDPSTTHGLENNLMSDAQRQIDRLYNACVVAPAEEARRNAATEANGGCSGQQAVQRRDLLSAQRALQVMKVRRDTKDHIIAAQEKKIVRLNKQLRATSKKHTSSVVRHLLGYTLYDGKPTKARELAATRSTKVDHLGYSPSALVEFESNNIQSILVDVAQDVIDLHLEMMEQMFMHEDRIGRIPPVNICLFEPLCTLQTRTEQCSPSRKPAEPPTTALGIPCCRAGCECGPGQLRRLQPTAQQSLNKRVHAPPFGRMVWECAWSVVTALCLA